MDINEKKIRLIALDMDGTLLNAGNEISADNKSAIKQAQVEGVEVILSTGRHYTTSLPFAKSLGINYLITVNGSEIWTAAGELLDRQLIGAEIIETLIQLKDKHNTWAWMASTDKIWRGEFPDDVSKYQWLKFGFDTDAPHIKEAIMAELSTNELIELSNSSLTNIEVNAAGINKAVAIEKVGKRLGITMDQVMAVGDSLNDIKMIEQAGLGIAMGNAQEPVKAKADWVTEDNVNHGVAEAIKHWVLK